MNPAERYLAERVNTADPAELTAMLYDAAVGAIKAAIRLREAGERAGIAAKIVKAQNIIIELRCTLNPAAGDLAVNLERLYVYAYEQLVAANSAQDTAALVNALDVVQPLQQAWRESCCRTMAVA